MNSRPRVVLITQGMSRVVIPLVRQKYVDLVGLVESAPRSLAGKKTGWRRRTIHFLKASILQLPSLKKVAVTNEIPFFFLSKEVMGEFDNWLKEQRVDLVIIYSMSQLLPKSILSIPNMSIINLHPSLLPKFRGPNPWFWTYYFFEKQAGVTLHFIDAGEDTGDIIFQAEYVVSPGMLSPDMQDIAIGREGVRLILKALKILGEGGVLPRRQQSDQVSYSRARNIKPTEHRSLIDWQNWPVERIWHVMRGTQSWLDCIEQPNGVYWGQRWVVNDYESHDHIDGLLLGSVCRDPNGFFVQCRNGRVRLSRKFSVWPLAKAFVQKLLAI